MEVDIEKITQLINSVGFPIAIAVILLWAMYKMMQSHKEELKIMGDSIDNNTLALTQIKTQMETFLSFIKDWHND